MGCAQESRFFSRSLQQASEIVLSFQNARLIRKNTIASIKRGAVLLRRQTRQKCIGVSRKAWSMFQESEQSHKIASLGWTSASASYLTMVRAIKDKIKNVEETKKEKYHALSTLCCVIPSSPLFATICRIRHLLDIILSLPSRWQRKRLRMNISVVKVK